MSRSGFALLLALLALPACAGNGLASGFHGGGFHGGGFHGGFPHGGFLHGGARLAFPHNFHRARGFFPGYAFGYGCGFGFDCEIYGPLYGYGYDGGSTYGGGPGNVVGGRGAPSAGGGYIPDPVGAEIPPVTFPSSCWVRRAGYDSSGAALGQILINVCHPPDNMIVTRVEARVRAPGAGAGNGAPVPEVQPGPPKSPR